MVSIILVTYNRAARLKLSIEDILNQTYRDFELIICDDCSTDATEDVCREFQKRDSRIKYFRHQENIQMPANCNFGIEKAKSEYIAILHDGDRFKPDLIEQWHRAISANGNVGFVFNSIAETDDRNQMVTSHHEFQEGIVDRHQLLKGKFFRRWRFNSPVYGEAMVRKSLLIERGLLHDEFGFYADVELWMDLLHSYDAYYCADTLISGPTKDLQPRLFEDNVIDYFLIMFNMHLKHRKKAFRENRLRLSLELVIFGLQSSLKLFYCLLLIIKNEPLRCFVKSLAMIKHNFIFLIPIAVTTILYPILFPLLRIYGLVKGSFPQLRFALKKKEEDHKL